MKRKRTARKPKAQRTSLDKQIATAPALPSKDGLGIPNKLSVLYAGYDFGRPHSNAEKLVFYYKYLNSIAKVLVREQRLLLEQDERSNAAYVAEVNEHFSKARKLLDNTASAFIWEVLDGCRPEKLKELAREMKLDWKRHTPQKDQKPLVERLVLLDASAGGAVPDFAKLARMFTDQELQVAAKHGLLSAKQLQDRKTEKALLKARSLRRIAHRIGVPTRAAGRPKKSDT